MLRVAYDLHLHSCLSPCGDDDMTPGNIVGMAVVNNLDVIAVTDHNTCRNCPPVMAWAQKMGLVAIPGMELTTEEEVHVLCLFSTLKKAMEFDQYVYEKLNGFPNNIALFGKQEIYNESDQKCCEEPKLLIQSTSIPFYQVYDLVKAYDGIMIPAHIDRTSHSLLYNLGFIPDDSKFLCAEVRNTNNITPLTKAHSYLKGCSLITNSDAHYLTDINDATHYVEVEEKSIASILDKLVTTKGELF